MIIPLLCAKLNFPTCNILVGTLSKNFCQYSNFQHVTFYSIQKTNWHVTLLLRQKKLKNNNIYNILLLLYESVPGGTNSMTKA